MLMMRARPDADRRTRYEIRYAGERHETRLRRALTGRFLDDVVEETEYRRISPALERIRRTGVPHHRTGQHLDDRNCLVGFERLMVPLCDDQGRPDFLLGVWHWPAAHTDHVVRLPNGAHMISSRHI